jgi:PAS domain S-box-containing protein
MAGDSQAAGSGEEGRGQAEEEALLSVEARDRALIETVPQIMWMLHKDGTVAFFNSRWYDYTGHPRDESGTEGWTEAVHPEDRRRVAELRQASIGSGTPYEVELRLRRHDGQYRWHQARVAPLNGEEGPLLGWVGAASDVDDRRRALEQLTFLDAASHTLRASLDYYATLRNLARLALPTLADYCVIDLLEPDGRVVRVETAHRDQAGEQLLREIQQHYPPNEHNPVRTILSGGATILHQTVDAELLDAIARDERHRTLLRELAPISWMIVPMRTGDRTVGTIALVMSEVSGRRFAPEDLALAEELGLRAALAVEHSRLYNQAQAGIRVRDTFLSVATHELRSPLTVIGGTAQILLRQRRRSGDLEPREETLLQRMVEQTQRLNRMIDVLLDFSRLRAGQLELDFEAVDIGRLACNVAEELTPTLTIHTLSCATPDEPLAVHGDPLRLGQVLHNLITNAVKYSPRGGAVTVRAWSEGGQVCVAVSDQGIGIPAEAQQRLFEQFYRAENAQRYAAGLGIGLAVSDGIVAAHGGTIDVTSEVGVGSTFTVRLPTLQPAPA